jgi:sugar phosphate isomerase/epimerase
MGAGFGGREHYAEARTQMNRALTSRRSFNGLLASAMLAPAKAAGTLNIGVGTFSYHLLSIDDMIVQLTKLGIQEIEMSRGEFMLMKPPTTAMCQSARDKFDKAGIRCVSYYTATIKDERDLDYAVRFAKILGARNVSGDATGAMLGRVDRRFTSEGLTFGIHNHWFKQKFAYESAEDVLNGLAGLSKTCGATLDVGQMAACGHDPVEAIRKLAPRLLVVHLKDVQAAGAEHNVLLGQGVAKIPEVMRELKKIGFGGLVAIEYEKDGDSNKDMEVLVNYARVLS